MAFENDKFTLSQDWELPIQGFFVLLCVFQVLLLHIQVGQIQEEGIRITRIKVV